MRHDDGHRRTDGGQTVIKETRVFRSNSAQAPTSGRNRTARLGVALAASTVLIAPMALMAAPSTPAAAASLGPAASHVLRQGCRDGNDKCTGERQLADLSRQRPVDGCLP